MNRSLDELTASELNDAIDDTNFPKALSTQCLSTPTAQPHVDEIAHAHTQNGKTANNANGHDNENGSADHAPATLDGQNANEPLSSNGQNGIKGFIKRAHPAPLKMVAFKGDSIDVPGTPRTPRTSTTPGKYKKLLCEWRNKSQNPLMISDKFRLCSNHSIMTNSFHKWQMFDHCWNLT